MNDNEITKLTNMKKKLDNILAEIEDMKKNNAHLTNNISGESLEKLTYEINKNIIALEEETELIYSNIKELMETNSNTN